MVVSEKPIMMSAVVKSSPARIARARAPGPRSDRTSDRAVPGSPPAPDCRPQVERFRIMLRPICACSVLLAKCEPVQEPAQNLDGRRFSVSRPFAVSARRCTRRRKRQLGLASTRPAIGGDGRGADRMQRLVVGQCELYPVTEIARGALQLVRDLRAPRTARRSAPSDDLPRW